MSSTKIEDATIASPNRCLLFLVKMGSAYIQIIRTQEFDSSCSAVDCPIFGFFFLEYETWVLYMCENTQS